ncbi:hypothetical protein NL676_036239 [Syzygium grande]|nr:hypothetical protein NL676_036239 [Syzygium grande]
MRGAEQTPLEAGRQRNFSATVRVVLRSVAKGSEAVSSGSSTSGVCGTATGHDDSVILNQVTSRSSSSNITVVCRHRIGSREQRHRLWLESSSSVAVEAAACVSAQAGCGRKWFGRESSSSLFLFSLVCPLSELFE